MDNAQVESKVREFVATRLLHGEDRGLDNKSPLLEWGVIESLSLLSLLDYLSAEFSVEVPDDEMRPENFANIDAITALVQRLSRGA